MTKEWEAIQTVSTKSLFVFQGFLESVTAWATKFHPDSRSGDDARHGVRDELRVLDRVNAEIMRRTKENVSRETSEV